MKRILILFLLIWLGGGGIAFALPDPNETLMQQQLEHLNLDEIEQYWQKIYQDYHGFLPEAKSPGLIPLMLQQEKGFTLQGILNGFLHFFFHEITVNAKLLGMILLLTIFASILENIQSSFEQTAVSKIAFIITFLVLMILAMNSFSVAMNYAKEAIKGMMDFMLAIVPLLVTLTVSMGNVAAGTFFHPFIIVLVHSSGTLVYYFVFPLLFFSILLQLVSLISERYKLTRLADLLRNIGLGTLGIFITVFLSVLSFQGTSTSISDGLALRTAKYMAGNFVPVVGHLFTDAAETVMGASLLLKNAVGITGVMILLFIAAFPAIKVLAIGLIYQIAAALLQPLGDHPMIAALHTIGNGMMLIFGALATVSLMFFLSLTILIASGNLALMIR
ncbi:MAG: stage III sporulation protein AE [Thermicanus sp.]|nr:stage III sporulation protein AE [Thermicanus sp.]